MNRAAFLICFLVAGCGQQAPQAEMSSTGQAGQQGLEPSARAPVAAPGGAGSTVPQVIPSAVRMIIRTANVSIVVVDAAAALQQAVTLAESQGGYVAGTRQWQQSGQVRATATLRVPAEKLTFVLTELRKLATRVNTESISGEDVSEEFTDLNARVTNLRATETELRQLLATVRERTQKASDILEVHRELAAVRTEIDRIQGRMDYLRQMTAMSTINLELIPDKLSEPIIEPGWSPLAVARNAARALVVTLTLAGTVFIWGVVYLVPLVLVGVLVVVGGRKVLWGRRKNP